MILKYIIFYNSMKTFTKSSLLLMVLISFNLFAQGGKNYGQFAPPEAYIDSSEFAYFGSENEWSQRMFSERAADRFYKRQGQRQMLAILAGRPEEAVKMCAKRIDENPDDTEAMFTMTVAYCQLNQVKKAYETMKRAVTAGLPFQRFLAGPRDLLQLLTNSDEFKRYAAMESNTLLHGPMLGAVTANSARFWVRTANETPLKVLIYDENSTDEPIQTAVGHTYAEQDYTEVIEVTGLEPHTIFWYDVVINNASVFHDNRPTFQTFVKKGSPMEFEIAFGGGAGFTPQHERIWDTIHSFHPDALFLLGDNVYIDLPEMPGAFHKYTYYRRQSRPEFRQLIQSTPVYTIWDDHDSAIDDIWMGPYRDKPDWKMPMLDVFRVNWNNPFYGDDEWPGCWYNFSVGDVDFFMLDCRFYRTNPFASNPTMLGPVQLKWLLEELGNSDGTFKVIVSSVPWTPDAKPGSHDTWDGFPQEREQIFSFIEQQKIEGVILMSADRHRSDIHKIEREHGYPLYDMMSSRLTNIHTHELVPGAIFGYNEKCSFGLLKCDTVSPDPSVTFRIVNIDGEMIHSITIQRSELSLL